MITTSRRWLVAPSVVACVILAGGCTDPEPLDLRAAVNAEVAAINTNGPYVTPTPDDLRRVEQALDTLCTRGGVTRASELLEPFGYTATAIKDDTFGERTLHLVREPADAGPNRRGWGLYVIDCRARDAPVVEVTHPVSDHLTEQLGVNLFAEADAGALLIAGAKRGPAGASSDVAHAPQSVLSTVHASLLRQGREVVQVHGFDPGNHPDLRQQAVVSSGSTDRAHSGLARAGADALGSAGVSVCLFMSGNACSDLGATKNVQGQSARDARAWFMHVELDQATRSTRADEVVAALARALDTHGRRP